MRTLSLGVLVLLPALALGACASPDGGGYRASPDGDRRAVNRSNDDFTKLQNDCEAQGGILAPNGRLTNEPSRDNVCRLDPAAPPPGR